MPTKKKTPQVPQTSLLDAQDALAVIGSTVDVAVAALEYLGENGAAEMLLHTVGRPLEAPAQWLDGSAEGQEAVGSVSVATLLARLVKLRERWLAEAGIFHQWAEDLNGSQEKNDDDLQTMLIANAVSMETCADEVQDAIDEHCL